MLFGIQIEFCMNFMSSEFLSKRFVFIINIIFNILMGFFDFVVMFKQCDLIYNLRFLNDIEIIDDF